MQTRGQRRACIQGLDIAQTPTNTSPTPSGVSDSSTTLTKQEHRLGRASNPSPPAHNTHKPKTRRHKRRHQKQTTPIPQPVNYTVQQYLAGVQAFEAARTAAAEIRPLEEGKTHPEFLSLEEQQRLASEEALLCCQPRSAQGDANSLENQKDFLEESGESHDEQPNICDER